MDITALSRSVLAGERRALARAITLVESNRADHRAQAEALLAELGQSGREALRIGLSGTPGVGKSTFIEALGLHLTEAGRRVAVLAVDPSSARSGGSILGDKTRMGELARAPGAFIRPSPAGGRLGGVARRSRDAVALCEAAGFDPVIVETVGVGQSEVQVAGMSDIFVLLLAPAGGDELQGVKRGIMEIADLIAINKADGALRQAAEATRADYASALRLMRPRPQDPKGFPKVLLVSALTGAGIAEAWAEFDALARWRRAQGHWQARRAAQRRIWFEDELRAGLLARLEDPGIRDEIDRTGQAVARGDVAPSIGARRILERIGMDRTS